MGQYYRPIIECEGKTKVYDLYVDGEPLFMKLMEHSWWSNPFVLAVAGTVFRKKFRLAWVGDYAGDTEGYDGHPAWNWREEFATVWKRKGICSLK